MRKIILLLAIMILAGCTTKQPATLVNNQTYYADTTFSSLSQNDRVRFLIIHYTATDNVASLKELTKGQVSTHYLITTQPAWRDNKPVILQLVPEEKRAWHAGLSSWNKRTNLNDTSIGIEIVNTGFTKDAAGEKIWYPYDENQIQALTVLAKDIIHRYHITPDNVLGHSDIAPLRKYDPGKLFPWQQLAKQGIGAWPDPAAVNHYLAGRAPSSPASVQSIQRLLKQYGYDEMPQSGVMDESTRKIISAFQMHFRPANIDGNADAETEAIARALTEKYRGNDA